jgi:multiple sugar transport system ATP-binding protein
MIAGLEDLTAGEIRLGDRVVNDVDPGERDIAMVFQNYALYPHMTVYQNMALSLRIRKLRKPEIRARVNEAAAVLRIEGLLKKRPRELSGGQRQRVAMGRAIVREPQAFLMDEPLSNLDAKLRVQMRAEILRIQRSLGITTVYVTHDQTEAMTLGDQAAVMKLGVLQQVDTPQTLYRRPANLFVAGFMGSPGMNMVEAQLRHHGTEIVAQFGSNQLRLSDQMRGSASLTRFINRRIVLGIRPEHIEDASLHRGAPDGVRLVAPVELREEMGSEILLHLGIDAPPVLTEDTRELAAEQGTDAVAALREQADQRRSVFVARVHADTGVRVGEVAEFVVDAGRLHFFDPETGAAIGSDDRDRVTATAG